MKSFPLGSHNYPQMSVVHGKTTEVVRILIHLFVAEYRDPSAIWSLALLERLGHRAVEALTALPDELHSLQCPFYHKTVLLIYFADPEGN